MTTQEDYIREEEWEDFQPAHVLSPDITGKLWNKIRQNTSHGVPYPYFKWAAVAASVALVVGLSWPFIIKKPKTSAISAATVTITRNISNNTPQIMTLTLSDGSTVELLPNSKLSYPETFRSSKRDVILDGEANFNIARDVAKPFSVFSNSVLITVLGTRFTVKTYEANNTTKVILKEGKVMVKTSRNEYYLAPGDIFIFKKVIKQSRGANPERTPTPVNISGDSSSARILHLEKGNDDGVYVFDNYPLDVVFDQLQVIYNTRIIYNKADLGNRTFIGKIDKKDSLYHILKSISLLNDFVLHKIGDGYVVSN